MTRIQQARRRVTIARYALGVTAAAALAAFAAVARASHPGTHSAPRVTRPSASSMADDYGDTSFFGDDSGAAIGPPGSAAPQVQSGAS